MSEKLSRILYAEDEKDIRAIAQVALEDIGGFTVQYCSNSKEVFEIVKDFAPQLLLLDVMMPGMDGPTILKILRDQYNMTDVPAIFMTAKIQAGEIMQYKEMGIIEVITKPFDPMLLAKNINDVWDKYLEATRGG
jgi:two-component system OmpR family response regulator